MGTWQTNPGCGCGRCRHGGFMGPAVLVTLGVLLLLSEWHVLSFGRTWPILLIVIGAVRVLWYAAGSSGHLENPPGPPAPPPPDNAPKQVEHV
jgi:Domain of unknown function (DUF5668)